MSRKRYTIFSTTFDKRGRAIATGTNDYFRIHPLMKFHAELVGESSEKIWKHSELEALLQSKSKDVHSILVQRFDSEGRPKIAKPCKTCQSIIKSFGVKIVRYTTEEGIAEYANSTGD